MPTFISILRGINVSGQKQIKMADLKALYETLNLKQVTTYIQSGNVVFSSNKKISTKVVETEIESAIKKHYGFDVPVLLRSHTEWKTTIKNNPFAKDADKDVSKMHVVYLANKPDLSSIEKLENAKQVSEEFQITGNQVYLYCPNGYGKTKLSNNFLEKVLKTTATTRNWKTVNKLQEIADGIA